MRYSRRFATYAAGLFITSASQTLKPTAFQGSRRSSPANGHLSRSWADPASYVSRRACVQIAQPPAPPYGRLSCSPYRSAASHPQSVRTGEYHREGQDGISSQGAPVPRDNGAEKSYAHQISASSSQRRARRVPEVARRRQSATQIRQPSRRYASLWGSWQGLRWRVLWPPIEAVGAIPVRVPQNTSTENNFAPPRLILHLWTRRTVADGQDGAATAVGALGWIRRWRWQS
jgi:hypothetical protein